LMEACDAAGWGMASGLSDMRETWWKHVMWLVGVWSGLI